MESDKKLEAENITGRDLEEQTQVLLSAFDSRFNSMEKHLTDVMDVRFAATGNRMDGMDSKLEGIEEKIDSVQTSIDGYIKKREDSEQENVIIKEEVKQMKSAFKEKLGVEIKAI
jgi:hypothetical protein